MGANTSFFDDQLDDESITLNDAELNNILEDSGNNPPEDKTMSGSSEFISDEPDVIVIDRKDILSRIPLLEKGAEIDIEPAGAVDEGDELVGVAEPLAVEEAGIAEVPEALSEDVTEPGNFQTVEEITLDESGLKELDAGNSKSLESAEEITLEDAGLTEALGSMEPAATLPVLEDDEDVSLSLEELDNITSMGGVDESGIAPVEEAAPASGIEAEEISSEELSELTRIEPLDTAEQSFKGPEEFAEPLTEEIPNLENIDSSNVPVESETIELNDLPSFDSEDNEITIAGLEDEEKQVKKFPEQAEVTEMPALNAVEEIGADEIPVMESETLPEMKETSPEEMTLVDNDELILSEPVESIDLEEAEVSGKRATPQSPSEEEFHVDEIDVTTGETLEQKPDHPVLSTSYFGDEDQDESITLSSDELDNIINTSDVKETAPEIKKPSHVEVEGSVSMDNLRELFVYLDNLLDKLPEGEVKKFSQSRYYDLYNKIFEEFNLV